MADVASTTLPADDPVSLDLREERLEAGTNDVHVRGSHRAVGPVALALMVYFSVSGGPVGAEGLVKAGGILMGCLGFLVFPWLYSFPIALMTAELASTWPQDGGYVVFTSMAMGSFMGWMQGFTFLLSGVIDTAIYPSLIISYALPAIKNGSWESENIEEFSLEFPLELLCRVLLVIVLSYTVYRGVKTIEAMMILIGAVLLTPLAIMIMLSLPRWDPGIWFRSKAFEDIDWTSYLNIVIWNVCGWEGVASYAGQVKDPGRTYPRAMTLCMVAVSIINGLSVLAGVCIDPETKNWNEGHFATIGYMVGGQWLGMFIFLAVCVGCAATFVSIQNQNAYMMAGMAQQGMLPKVLQVVGKRNTPYASILTCGIFTSILSVLSFEEIVGLEMLFLALGTQLEVAVFFILRFKQKTVVRPYTMPGSTMLGAFLFLSPPISVTVILLLVTTVKSILLGLAFILLGALIFFLGRRCRTGKEGEDQSELREGDSSLLQEIQLEPLEEMTNRRRSSPSMSQLNNM